MLGRNKAEIEKKDYIWRRKIYFFRGEQNRERKMRNLFGDGNYVFAGEILTVEEKEEII